MINAAAAAKKAVFFLDIAPEFLDIAPEPESTAETFRSLRGISGSVTPLA
jgi:hypothetical protein